MIVSVRRRGKEVGEPVRISLNSPLDREGEDRKERLLSRNSSRRKEGHHVSAARGHRGMNIFTARRFAFVLIRPDRIISKSDSSLHNRDQCRRNARNLVDDQS